MLLKIDFGLAVLLLTLLKGDGPSLDSPSWAIMSVVAMIVAIVVANVVVVAVEDLG